MVNTGGIMEVKLLEESLSSLHKSNEELKDTIKELEVISNKFFELLNRCIRLIP